MPILKLAIIPFLIVLLGANAYAQQESRQERQLNATNRSLRQKQQTRQQLQQNQFEINQLHQSLQRDKLFSTPPIGQGPGMYRR